MSRIANTLHQITASLALRRIATERSKIFAQNGDPGVGTVNMDELAVESQTSLPSVIAYRRDFVATNRARVIR